MSIVIKGMKMPESCFDCDLYGDESNYCKAQKEFMPFASFGRDYKDANCPLVELPEKHGRLIDADAMVNLWKGCTFEGSVGPLLDTRPTVIEAEGEEWPEKK